MSDDAASYLKFTGRQNLDKDLHQLEGVLRGILLDGKVSAGETKALHAWRMAVGLDGLRPPFKEIVDSLDVILADGRVDAEEVKDLLWLSERFTTKNDFYNAVTSDIQRLHGMCKGLLSDGILSDDEIRQLADWLDEHDDLRSVYPYDELCSFLTQILEDGRIDDDERDLLTRFLHDMAPGDDRKVIQYAGISLKDMTLPAVCAMNVEIPIDNSMFCFTGASATSTRGEIHATIKRIGGRVHDRVTRDVDFLVVGDKGNPCWAFAKYGRKIEKAMNLRRNGARILIVKEVDFWDAVADFE